jgi:hypothetical protein
MFRPRSTRTDSSKYLLAFIVGIVLLVPIERAFAQSPVPSRQLGTVKSVAADSLTIATDAGQQIVVQVQADAKIVKLPAGSKDMKDAQPIELKAVEIGDRVLLRGTQGDTPAVMTATSVIVMKGGELQQKHQQEQEDWQKRGIGGLVSAVDPAANTVTISTTRADGTRKTVIHISSTTVIRRYAPDSVKFEDAQPSALAQIKPGDQLRARGSRTAEGDFDAEGIVSGSFHNVAGTVLKLDASTGILHVKDAASQKTISLKISPDSQLRRLPAAAAQMIARRTSGGGDTPAAGTPATGSSTAAHPQGGGHEGAPDLQQMLGRLPRMPIDDLHTGDAVMIVATPGSTDGQGTVITLLAGVEAILAATPKGSQVMTLSPWNINGSAGDSSSAP